VRGRCARAGGSEDVHPGDRRRGADGDHGVIRRPGDVAAGRPDRDALVASLWRWLVTGVPPLEPHWRGMCIGLGG
jgi:hypothetical protein